jgi:fumarate reductase subunit D
VSRAFALVHRVSGIALALFLPVHFWALGKGLELQAFLAWTEQPLVKLAEWGMVVLLAAHLGAGLRVLAIEFLDHARRGARARAGAVESAAGG